MGFTKDEFYRHAMVWANAIDERERERRRRERADERESRNRLFGERSGTVIPFPKRPPVKPEPPNAA